MNEAVAVEANVVEKKAPRIGFYDIDRTIGKGNFGVVKLAQHRITKSKVAIKIIDKSHLDDAGLKKVYREISILKQLHHPNIVSLYQVMESEKMLYIVTEYVPNGEVYEFITKNGRFTEVQARQLFSQVVKAVRFCHDNHIVHRDLKAENLLIDHKLNLKLADFGFGSFYQVDQQLSTWCGSPPYAAPEMFLGKPYDPHTVDIWSLGVILYVLVCGALPFDAPTLPALKKRVLSCRFRIPFFMSTDCESLIRRMLVRDPPKRLRFSEIPEQKWMSACRESPAQPSEESAAEESEPDKQKHHDQALRLMKSLGINIEKSLESIRLDTYDHYTAIYLLLCERSRQQAAQSTKQQARPAADSPPDVVRNDAENTGRACEEKPAASAGVAKAEQSETVGLAANAVEVGKPEGRGGLESLHVEVEVAPAADSDGDQHLKDSPVADGTLQRDQIAQLPHPITALSPASSALCTKRGAEASSMAIELHRYSVDEGIMIDESDRVSRSLHPSKSFASSTNTDKQEDSAAQRSVAASSQLSASDASEYLHDTNSIWSSPLVDVGSSVGSDENGMPRRNDTSTENFDSDERTVTENSERTSTPKMTVLPCIESVDCDGISTSLSLDAPNQCSSAGVKSEEEVANPIADDLKSEVDARVEENDRFVKPKRSNLTPLRICTKEIEDSSGHSPHSPMSEARPLIAAQTPRRQHIGLPLLPSKSVVTQPVAKTTGPMDVGFESFTETNLSPRNSSGQTTQTSVKPPVIGSPLRVDELSRSAPRFLPRCEPQPQPAAELQKIAGPAPRICTPMRR